MTVKRTSLRDLARIWMFSVEIRVDWRLITKASDRILTLTRKLDAVVSTLERLVLSATEKNIYVVRQHSTTHT